MKRILLSLFILLGFCPIMDAQSRFIKLDWDQLPEASTLPEVVEVLPLPDDYERYAYSVAVEYPEFEPLSETEPSYLLGVEHNLANFPKCSSRIGVSRHKAFLHVTVNPIVWRDGCLQRMTTCKLAVSRHPRSLKQQKEMPALVSKSVLSEGLFVKIRVSSTGICRLSYDALRSMGFKDPSKVSVFGYGGNLLSATLGDSALGDLPQVPVRHINKGLLFYAYGPLHWSWNGEQDVAAEFTRIRNFYSDYGYYFLSDAVQNTAIFPIIEADQQEGGEKITTFNEHVLYEEDGFSWASTGRDLYDSFDFASNSSQQYAIPTPDIVSHPGKIHVRFAARSVGTSTTLTLSSEGQEIKKQNISALASSNGYRKAYPCNIRSSWTGSKETSVFVLKHTRPVTASGRLDYIALNYTRRLNLKESSLIFRSVRSAGDTAHAYTYEITGANEGTEVWDVTSAMDIKQVKGVLKGNTYTFTVQADGILHEYVAFNNRATSFGVKYAQIGEVPNQNLHALDGVNMVIIVPETAGFETQAERLAQAHREHDSMTVQVVNAQQIYNEFSSGTPDATAYRRFLKMLYDKECQQGKELKYVLLFGDGCYDNRMLTATWKKFRPSDFLLTYQSEESLTEEGSFVADDYFGFMDAEEGHDLASSTLDIGVGRFPVRTVTEAKALVDKTIAYMNNEQAGPWKKLVCFVADDDDASEYGLKHMADAEKVASMIEKRYPELQVERVYADSYKREATATGNTYPDATKRLLNLFQDGMLVVNYTGHGSTTAWAEEKLLVSDDIVKMRSEKLPLWITATCDFARYDDVSNSAGELALLNPDGGAIALFSTSRVVYASSNMMLNIAFNECMFERPDGKRLALGDIMRSAKSKLPDDSNKTSFALLGDPALVLAYPDYKVEVETLSGGEAPDSDLPFAQAGGKLKVKGRILTPEGKLADDFSGEIYPRLYDHIEKVKTLNNVGWGAFEYFTRTNTLFMGRDSVRNGSFEMELPIPMDISYSDESGMLNLYACSSDKREAGGAYDRFMVGGTSSDMDNTKEGPKLFVYLNTPDFQWGDRVNETPCFIAEISDANGINTTGNGIGHDLTLSIDGRLTYALNEYYAALAGDYTKGRVAFPIPALSPGKHSLVFRAWDVLNNASSAELEFEVVEGLAPSISSVYCTESPARTQTTFIITHNRPETGLRVSLSVFDFLGNELWRHVEEGSTPGNQYLIDWNLCSQVGQRLRPGVYFYRATLQGASTKEVTKTEKIVILAQ